MNEIDPKAQPFFITGHSQQALLFLHGFTASPSEVRPTAEKLNKINDCSISGILLPGHGTSPQHLHSVRWPEWHKAIETEIESLQSSYRQVFVGGLSMGGLLALHAGVNIKGLAGVISINAPLYYHSVVIPLLSDLTGTVSPYYHKKNLPVMREMEDRGRFAYRVMPLKAFHSLNNLRKIVMKELNQLEIPALIFQAKRDESVHPRSGAYLYEKTAGAGAKLIMLTQSRHVATMGDQADIIAREMADFMKTKGDRIGN